MTTTTGEFLAGRGDQILVQLPSGAPIEVLSEDEGLVALELVDRYMSQYALTNVSDLAELDRVVTMELLTYRWGVYMLRGADYHGKTVNVDALQRQVKEYSTELRQLKKLLGIDKLNRDRTKGEGSLPHYIGRILDYARRFGIHRETQLDKALELMNELIGMLQLHHNLTDKERRELRVTAEDIVDWGWNRMRPEYQAIDDYFVEHDQRLWISQL